MGRYLLTVADLAAELGKSHQTINRMVESGALPFEPVAGLKVRHFRRSDVEAWLGAPIDLSAAS